MLQREKGVRKASAFIGGIVVLTRLVQGAYFGLVLREAESGEPTETRQLVTAILLLVVGLLMIVNGIRLLLKEDDPDDPPRSAGRQEGFRTSVDFGLGVLLVVVSAKQWMFMLAGLAVIAEGKIGRTASIASYLIYVVGATSLLLIPYLARVTNAVPIGTGSSRGRRFSARVVRSWLSLLLRSCDGICPGCDLAVAGDAPE